MDVFDYIDSRTERNYLRHIDYKFSIAEAAFFVNHSAVFTFEQKVKAYEELIGQMKNMPYRIQGVEKNFSEWLLLYIRATRKLINWFKQSEPDFVYTFSTCFHMKVRKCVECCYCGENHQNVYGSLAVCLTKARNSNAAYTKVRKVFVRGNSDDEEQVKVLYNEQMEIMSVTARGSFPEVLTDDELLATELFESFSPNIPRAGTHGAGVASYRERCG